MGRLFWKFFFTFWLALLAAGLGVGVAVWLHNQANAELDSGIDRGPPAVHLVRSSSLILKYSGVAALKAFLQQSRDDPLVELYVVDANGQDLLGREVQPHVLAQAKAQAVSGQQPVVALEMMASDGKAYLFFAARRPQAAGEDLRPMRPRPPSPLFPIAAGIIASLVFSALLAWYFSKPIRSLRSALGAAAQGDLGQRIAARMGGRHDELADLGQLYDHMAERLRALMDAQQRLLHDVSHELRSPLARLQAAIGLARQDPTKMEATLDRLEREAMRLDDLVGELLTLSRLEAGTVGTDLESVDLVELAEAIAEDARFEAETAFRELSFQGSGTALAEVQGELLSRAFENVIRNGIKYTRINTAVEVEASLTADGKHFRLMVADRGPGGPDQELESIFEPFYRGRNGHATAGYGLGLAIAIRAVEAHGGTLLAHNREGGGLVVEVRVPLHGRQPGVS